MRSHLQANEALGAVVAGLERKLAHGGVLGHQMAWEDGVAPRVLTPEGRVLAHQQVFAALTPRKALRALLVQASDSFRRTLERVAVHARCEVDDATAAGLRGRGAPIELIEEGTLGSHVHGGLGPGGVGPGGGRARLHARLREWQALNALCAHGGAGGE